MDEMKKILQKQYEKEFKLRKIIAIMLAVASVFFSGYGYFIIKENSCIHIICLSFFILTILPLPKDWKIRVQRNSRKPIFGGVKCVCALIALMINTMTVNWAPVSCFGLLLAIYGAAITPYLKHLKDK